MTKKIETQIWDELKSVTDVREAFNVSIDSTFQMLI